jgi:hypothetical protein
MNNPLLPPGPGEILRGSQWQPPRSHRMSDILQAVAEAKEPDRITLGDLLHALEGRASCALLLIFAFPNILPSPPGLAGILGLPLVYLSAQMMLGRPAWLPKFIARRSIARASFAALVNRVAPWLTRAEGMLTRRLTFLTSVPVERLLGAVCLFLSLMLILPIPFGNLLPSFAICIIALGILERDGLWILLGLIAALIATLVVGGLAYALVKSAIFVAINAF